MTNVCKKIMLQVMVRNKQFVYNFFNFFYYKYNNFNNFKIQDDDDIYNSSNLHSEDQDELEISESKLLKYCDTVLTF